MQLKTTVCDHSRSIPFCSRALLYICADTLNDDDGEFGLCHTNEVTQIMFHVATMMPMKASDPNMNGKKLHIGMSLLSWWWEVGEWVDGLVAC